MILNVYAILDDKSGLYSLPFYNQHDGIALRIFGDEVNNPQSNLNKHTGDFHLYKLGTFNDESGEFENSDKPKFLAHGVDFVKKS